LFWIFTRNQILKRFGIVEMVDETELKILSKRQIELKKANEPAYAYITFCRECIYNHCKILAPFYEKIIQHDFAMNFKILCFLIWNWTDRSICRFVTEPVSLLYQTLKQKPCLIFFGFKNSNFFMNERYFAEFFYEMKNWSLIWSFNFIILLVESWLGSFQS
jgi:hypothetical protein